MYIHVHVHVQVVDSTARSAGQSECQVFGIFQPDEVCWGSGTSRRHCTSYSLAVYTSHIIRWYWHDYRVGSTFV